MDLKLIRVLERDGQMAFYWRGHRLVVVDSMQLVVTRPPGWTPLDVQEGLEAILPVAIAIYCERG